jgi:hypothetical protein
MKHIITAVLLLAALRTAHAADGCTTPPYTQYQYIRSRSGEVCTIDLDWSAAVSRCGKPLVYSVHRSTQRDFVPDVGNRIAACLNSEGFRDQDVQSGAKYYYVVQAEDAADPGAPTCGAGNLAPLPNRVSARAVGTTEAQYFSDDVEGAPKWTASGSGAGADFAVVSTITDLGKMWFVADPAAISERFLTLDGTLPVPATGASWFDFLNLYDMESNADGGTLEYFSNGAWHDILAGDGATIPADPDRLIAYGYEDLIDSIDAPLAGRRAWTGTSNLDFLPTRVDLSAMAGHSIGLRFHFASDSSVSRPGWRLDRFAASQSSDCTVLSDVLVFRGSFE